MRTYKYPMVSFSKWQFNKWHKRFGTELVLKMDKMVRQERLRVGDKVPIKIEFNGDINNLPEDAYLNTILLRKPVLKWGILGKLFGKKYSNCIRLIVFKAMSPQEAAWRYGGKVRKQEERFIRSFCFVILDYIHCLSSLFQIYLRRLFSQITLDLSFSQISDFLLNLRIYLHEL